MVKKTITSEYVSYGHPDKIADQIADAILDEFIKNDKNCRTGIEVLVKDNIIVLGGEVHSNAVINYEEVVRDIVSNFSFSEEHHFSPSEIKVINLIGKQSSEIHNGVDKSENNIGAGDQGFMVGFASNETDVFMPLGHYIAKTICNYVSNLTPIYGPDTKSQVTIEYNENNEPSIKHILISTMHQDSLYGTQKFINSAIKTNKIGLPEKIYGRFIKYQDFDIDINPCGEWKIGGPISDCGVTGRKLVVDAYGGYCNIGGGNYSGKDFTKVDRSAAYMARYLAKNIVASGICNTAKVTLSYIIGIPEPSDINIELDINNDKCDLIKKWIKANVVLTPKGIIERFNGFYPRYYNASRFGHYGFNVDSDENLKKLYPWEETDIASRLKLFLL